jgi:hypothetical protein
MKPKKKEIQESTTQKGEDKHTCLSGIRTHDLIIQTIKAYASDRAVTETG